MNKRGFSVSWILQSSHVQGTISWRKGMQRRKKWGKSWIQLSAIYFRCIRHLCSSRRGSQGEVGCHRPRADLVTHSPARPRQSNEGRPRRRFSPGPAMCVPSPESTTPQHSDFLHFTVSLYLVSDPFSPFLFPFLLFLCSLPRKV